MKTTYSIHKSVPGNHPDLSFTPIDNSDKPYRSGFFGGGANRIGYYGGQLYVTRPNYIITAGTSTGSIEAVLCAAQLWDVMDDAILNMSNSLMYGYNPFNRKGELNFRFKVASIYNKITGKSYLTDISKPLLKTLRKYYTKADHLALQASGRRCYVTTSIDSHTNIGIVYHCSDDYDYENFTLAVVGSCAIPQFAKPVHIPQYTNDKIDYGIIRHSDGGAGESTPTGKIAEMSAYPIDVYLHEHKDKRVEYIREDQDIKRLLNQFFTISTQAKKGDLDKLPLSSDIFYLPPNITGSLLDFSKEAMSKMFYLGVERGKEINQELIS